MFDDDDKEDKSIGDVRTFRDPENLVEELMGLMESENRSETIKNAILHSIKCPNAVELSNQIEKDNLFTVQDLSIILNIPKRTIYDWCKDGLKKTWINKKSYLIKLENLIDYTKKNNINSIKFTELFSKTTIHLSEFNTPKNLVKKYNYKFEELTITNLWYWLRENKIKNVKPNREHYLVHEKSLLDFLEERNRPIVEIRNEKFVTQNMKKNEGDNSI